MVTVDAVEMAKAIDTTGRVALYGIYFDFNKADVKPESDATLQQIAALMKENTALKLLVVATPTMSAALRSTWICPSAARPPSSQP